MIYCSMIKKFLLLFLFSILFPLQVRAQTLAPSSVASVSPQIRNRLQLLLNPDAADSHFQRLHRRLKALFSRLAKINNRIEKRISKITASSNITNRLNSQNKSIKVDLDNINKELLKVENSWKIIKENKNSEGYETLKKQITNLLNSSESVVINQKTLVKELKKYKSKPEPTQKVSTESTVL